MKIDTYLPSHGFTQGHGDYNLYIPKKGDKILFLALYVDDFLFIGNYLSMIEWFKVQLETRFKMFDLSEGNLTLI